MVLNLGGEGGQEDQGFDGCFFGGNKTMVLKFKTKIT